MHSIDAVPLVPLLSPPPPLLTLCRSFFFFSFFEIFPFPFHCSVCEVYCGFFGNCQVILPTINSIMLSIDDSEDKMKWLVINVAKLEEEQRHLLAEEEKKKNDMENVQRRKAANERADESAGQAEEGGAAGGAADGNHHGRAGSLALAGDDEEESQWPAARLPHQHTFLRGALSVDSLVAHGTRGRAAVASGAVTHFPLVVLASCCPVFLFSQRPPPPLPPASSRPPGTRSRFRSWRNTAGTTTPVRYGC